MRSEAEALLLQLGAIRPKGEPPSRNRMRPRLVYNRDRRLQRPARTVPPHRCIPVAPRVRVFG
jgi:hypothetical protein